MPAAPTYLARIVAAVVVSADRRPWAVLAIFAVLLVASGWYAAARLEYRTQRNDLLSANKDCQKRWQKYLDAFGDDDDVVVAVRGPDAASMTRAADAAAAKLASRPDLFDRVFHRVDLRGLRSRALLHLGETELAALDRQLDDMAPLLGELAPVAWHALTLDRLLDEAAARPNDAALRARLTAVLRGEPHPWSLGRTRDAGAEAKLNAPQYFFTPDGQLALVLARPVKEASSFTAAKQATDAARAMLAELRAEFPRLDFGLTGIPVLETDEMAASDDDSQRASWLALVGVAALYFAVYRGFRYPLLTVGTLVVGTVLALGWATLTVGHLNILSATFAVMIIGLGDYGVLWVARYDEERRHLAHAGALRATATHAGPAILIAAITTALAFFATMFADFQAVAELGWIAGSGVFLCAVACLTLLPALMSLARREVAPPDVLPFAPRAFLPALARRPRGVLLASLAVMLAAGAAASQVKYDPNLLHMQARGLESVAWEEELLRHSAGATWDALSLTADREAALAAKARFEALPGVGRVVEAASLLPGDQERKLPVLASIHGKLAKLPATFAPGRSQSLPAKLDRLRASATDANLQAAIDAFRAAPDADIDRKLAASLHEELAQLRSLSEPRPLTVADLPPEFRERYIGAHGEFLVRAYAAGNLWEYDELAAFTAAAATADPQATGKAFRTLEGLDQMKRGFGRAALLALGVIVGVLWLDLRRMRSLLLGLLPLACGVVLTLGVMAACGVPLNPANLIALPLIVGVGVDNGVHVLHDHAEGRRGRYELGAATGRGIFVAALTTVLGFGTLILARHRGMASLGLTLTLGVAACMIAALVVLPALLRVLGAPEAKPEPLRLRRAA